MSKISLLHWRASCCLKFKCLPCIKILSSRQLDELSFSWPSHAKILFYMQVFLYLLNQKCELTIQILTYQMVLRVIFKRPLRFMPLKLFFIDLFLVAEIMTGDTHVDSFTDKRENFSNASSLSSWSYWAFCETISPLNASYWSLVAHHWEAAKFLGLPWRHDTLSLTIGLLAFFNSQNTLIHF